MAERKMNMWLHHKKGDFSKWLFTSSLLSSIVVFLVVLFVFEAQVNNNFKFSSAVYTANQITSDIFLHLGESLNNYLEMMSYSYCLQNGCLTAEANSSFNSLLPESDVFKYLSKETSRSMEDTGKSLDDLVIQVLNLKHSYGMQMQSWFIKLDKEFIESRQSKSYSSLREHQAMPSLHYLQSVSSMITRIRWMTEFGSVSSNNLIEMETSDNYLDLKNSIINDGIKLTLEHCYFVTKSLSDLQQTSSFTKDVTDLLIAFGVILGVCFVLKIAALWSVQSHLSSALDGFCMLQRGDLTYEIEKLHYCLRFYDSDDLFDEKERMNRAIMVYVLTSDRDKKIYHGGFNDRTSRYMMNSILQETFVKKSLMLKRNHKQKMKANALLKGISRSLVYGLLLIALIVSSSSFFVVISGFAKSTNELKLIMIQSTSMMMTLQLDFAAMSLYSPYAISGLKSGWTEAARLISKYKQDQQQLASFFNQERQNVARLLGKNNKFENIVYSDLCLEAASVDEQKSDWSACTQLNQKIATKGLLAFVFYASEWIRDLEARLATFLNIRDKEAPTALTEAQQSRIVQIFYAQSSLELRKAHPEIFSQSMKTILGAAHASIKAKEDQIFALLAAIRAAGLAIVCIAFMVIVMKTGRLIDGDWSVAMHVFEVISPGTINSNQYLFSKFKKFFNTASY